MLDLNSTTYWDKVYGCWLGKNAGGTLGTPLEKAWGEPEPFDVWWYPELREGGLPNDDLEMQMVWLKALEEVGPGLKAADLAQYWLDHIGYNWDEYGLNKTNLLLGLTPPVSGAYNNWFKDCMGCPIRSEIWACVAPGVPNLAIKYAFQDAICDHAGGESVFGELFNAATQSAAFVLSDREKLLDLGLTYIPEWSATAKAITAVRNAYKAGEDWKTARKRVLEATPHYNAQYSPINIGFQVIGLLYGEDFGDSICKTVNCGYDTDSSGASIGSLLGILYGKSGLPQKWIEPLGDTISTNESWQGVRHLGVGPNPVPANLNEFTERVCASAKRVLGSHGLLAGGVASEDELYAGPEVKALWSANPMLVEYQLGSLKVAIDYGTTPSVLPNSQKQVVAHITNMHPDTLKATFELRLPTEWSGTELSGELVLDPDSTTDLAWKVNIPAPATLKNSNRLTLDLQVARRPFQPAIPVVLVGAHRYRFTTVPNSHNSSDRELFDQAFEVETMNGAAQAENSRSGSWTDLYSNDNSIPLEKALKDGGVYYVQNYLWSPEAREVWLGVATTNPSKAWVNNRQVIDSFRYRPLRPNYGGDEESYKTVSLVEGWNEVLIKFVQPKDSKTVESHLMLSTADKLHWGLPEIGRTSFPWDK